jgi:hypothetical protein
VDIDCNLPAIEPFISNHAGKHDEFVEIMWRFGEDVYRLSRVDATLTRQGFESVIPWRDADLNKILTRLSHNPRANRVTNTPRSKPVSQGGYFADGTNLFGPGSPDICDHRTQWMIGYAEGFLMERQNQGSFPIIVSSHGYKAKPRRKVSDEK